MTWRVGTTVPINVYEDDRPICQCHDGATAKRIVDGMNLAEGLKHSAPSIIDLLQKARSFTVSTEQLLDQVINHSGLV